MHAATLRTEVSLENENWIVQVTADRFAQSVHFDAEGFRPSDDWFHLAPGEARTVELRPTGPHNSQAPKGEIRTLGSNQVFRF